MKYYSLNEYLKDTFGCKVYKIAIDAGFTCPVRDGALGSRGCIFCSGGGSGDFTPGRGLSVSEQLDRGKGLLGKKIKNGKYIAYFQSFTNTYADADRLERLYGDVIRKKEILEKIAQLRATCDEIGEGTVAIEETEDVDWINNWKEYFHQFWIDDILVIPSWEKQEDEARTPVLTFHIDPGTAFGTGMHETTQLCIRQIRNYITPETVMLDVGTGSGILSILSLMLGIKEAVGTDLDPCTLPAIADNLETNGVNPARMQVLLGNLIDDPAVQEQVGTGRYDIVAANILPDVLIPLTPQAVRCMKPGAVYITSGILEGREESVAEAMRKEGLTIESITAQGEWRCVVGRKPEA